MIAVSHIGEVPMRAETIKVGGMTCGGCVDTITKALKAVEGVRQVSVSLESGEASVEFDESATSPGQLRATVQQAGYEVDVADGKSQKKGGCCN